MEFRCGDRVRAKWTDSKGFVTGVYSEPGETVRVCWENPEGYSDIPTNMLFNLTQKDTISCSCGCTKFEEKTITRITGFTEHSGLAEQKDTHYIYICVFCGAELKQGAEAGKPLWLGEGAVR